METLMPEMARSTHDTMNTMATTGRAFAGTTSTAPAPTVIHTTLYNLIVALSAEVGPDDEDVVTATLVHLLQTYRVTGTGTLQGYRLVCDGAERVARSVPSADEGSSYGRGPVAKGSQRPSSQPPFGDNAKRLSEKFPSAVPTPRGYAQQTSIPPMEEQTWQHRETVPSAP
jgi:hypothetical protein